MILSYRVRLSALGAALGLVVAATSLPAVTAAPVAHPRAALATGAPRAWAARALRTDTGRLGVDASAVRWELVRHSIIGTHVRGREYRDGVPVAGTYALVSRIHGRIAQVEARGSRLPGDPVRSPVGAVVARAAALHALHVTSLLGRASVVRELVPVGHRLVDTYRVSLVSAVPARAARIDVGAATGVVRRIADVASYDERRAKGASVTAKVFDPNPVVTSHNPALRSPFETGSGVDVPLDSAALTKQLKVRTMKDLDAGRLALGLLSGRYVNVMGIAGYLQLTGGPLSYSRSDPRFVGLMAYEHIDRYQRWLQSLGLKRVNQQQQDVVPTLVQGYDNSFYQPGNDVIVYGGGGVPDAEDAEVILHEYGHAMQDAQVPGFGANEQGGSMGEGFGDFNAANYYALTSGGYHDTCAGDWDSTTYSTDHPPCLRRLDSTKRFPKDVEKEVHADGEMWSAFLWRLRSHLGDTTKERSAHAIRLVVAMQELLTPNAHYGNAVAGLRSAARALGHPRWVRFVNREATKTGYPLNR